MVNIGQVRFPLNVARSWYSSQVADKKKTKLKTTKVRRSAVCSIIWHKQNYKFFFTTQLQRTIKFRQTHKNIKKALKR